MSSIAQIKSIVKVGNTIQVDVQYDDGEIKSYNYKDGVTLDSIKVDIAIDLRSKDSTAKSVESLQQYIGLQIDSADLK